MHAFHVTAPNELQVPKHCVLPEVSRMHARCGAEPVHAVRPEQVLLRGRAHTVRGKGKSSFIVLRQRTQTIQVPF